MEVLDLRSYQRAYEATKQAEAAEDSTAALGRLPDGVADMVYEVEFELLKERNAQ